MAREADIRLSDGVRCIGLMVAALPAADSRTPDSLFLADSAVDTEPTVQLLETAEYRYRIEAPPDSDWRLEPSEIFRPDDSSGRSGRIRTGLATGVVEVEALGGAAPLRGTFEVRSRKLNYDSDYQWMLRDIAVLASELTMSPFGASSNAYGISEDESRGALYQKFEFLRANIDRDVRSGLRRILAYPHVAWIPEPEASDPRLGIAPSSSLVRNLVKPGPRISVPLAAGGYLPIELPRRQSSAVVDTPANRFVKATLASWVGLCLDVERSMSVLHSPAGRRGTEASRTLRVELESVARQPMWDDVGEMRQAPGDDQVLQRREGYREVYRTALDCELAAQLRWAGAEDVYRAGQRNVAALYEYWTFLQLLDAVREVCGGSAFECAGLVAATGGGLELSLQRGREAVANWTVMVGTTQLAIQLWFNRTFGGGKEGSWARPMRPDASIRVAVVPEGGTFAPVWVHFDAKYRIDDLRQLFATDAQAGATLDNVVTSGP